MDSGLNRDLLNAARSAGADDCVIAESDILSRCDCLKNAEITHRLENIHRATFCARVGDGISAAEISDDPKRNFSPAHLKQIIADTVQAAHIVNAWRMFKPCPDLRALWASSSPQDASAEWTKLRYCQSFAPDETCKKPCALPDCLQSPEFDAIPLVRVLAETMANRFPDIGFSAEQNTRFIRQTLSFPDKTAEIRRFETRLTQFAHLPPGNAPVSKLRLPTIVCDGLLTEGDIDLIDSSLSAARLAPGLMRTLLTTADPSDAPRNIGRVALSPWAAALLMHETQHIGLTPEFSPEIIAGYAQNFGQPPQSARICRGLAIAPFGGDRTDAPAHAKRHEPDFSSLPARSFAADAPYRIIRRRNTVADIDFLVAAIAGKQGYEQHFKTIAFRFDLKSMWKNATAHSNYAQTISLPCADGFATYRLPWIAVDGVLKTPAQNSEL